VFDLDCFIEDDPGGFQRGIDNSPCFPAFTGFGEFAGDLRASALPVMQQVAPEARVKITETIGIVPFVDAGSYYESPVPQLGRTLFYGVGLGLRYYTAFRPLRLNLATPLHKRSADSPIQVHISLGQAL
jgi:translocation and assembly module TamA